MAGPAPFAAVFLGHAYPIPASSFTQVDSLHWVLDVAATVRPDYQSLKDVCLFLTAPGLLGDDAALGLYVKVGSANQDWGFRGFVWNRKPSDVFSLQFPELTEPLGPGVVQIGVSVEPRAELEQKEFVRQGSKEEFAKNVAFDLLRYVESFGHYNLPVQVVEQWYEKFLTKFRKDPNFLSRLGAADKV